MHKQDGHFYEFGRFRLITADRVLLRQGELVPLTPKVFDILLALVENGGRLVEKDDLMKRVWPDTFVEEGNLTQNISLLRKALGEGPGGQQFIETIPRRGYRFVSPIAGFPDEALPSLSTADAALSLAGDSVGDGHGPRSAGALTTVETDGSASQTIGLKSGLATWVLASSRFGGLRRGTLVKTEAQKVLRELDELQNRRYVSPYTLAAIYAGLREKDQAFKWLEKAYEERDIWLMNLKVDPVFSKLRADRRFPDLLARAGLRP